MRLKAISKLYHSACAGWHRIRSAVLQERSAVHAGKAREHDWYAGQRWPDDERTELDGGATERRFRPF